MPELSVVTALTGISFSAFALLIVMLKRRVENLSAQVEAKHDFAEHRRAEQISRIDGFQDRADLNATIVGNLLERLADLENLPVLRARVPSPGITKTAAASLVRRLLTLENTRRISGAEAKALAAKIALFTEILETQGGLVDGFNNRLRAWVHVAQSNFERLAVRIVALEQAARGNESVPSGPRTEEDVLEPLLLYPKQDEGAKDT